MHASNRASQASGRDHTKVTRTAHLHVRTVLLHALHKQPHATRKHLVVLHQLTVALCGHCELLRGRLGIHGHGGEQSRQLRLLCA